MADLPDGRVGIEKQSVSTNNEEFEVLHSDEAEDKARDVSVQNKGLMSVLAKGFNRVMGYGKTKENPPLEASHSLPEVTNLKLALHLITTE